MKEGRGLGKALAPGARRFGNLLARRPQLGFAQPPASGNEREREETEDEVGFLQRLKYDLKAGWATLRYGTAQAANRALEETELLKLRLELRKLDEQVNDLYRDIGERAIELHDRGEPAERVLYDMEIVRLAEQVEGFQDRRKKIESEMKEIKSEV